MQSGDRICGFDFGSKQRQIAFCLLEVDFDAPNNFRVIEWDFVCFPVNESVAKIGAALVEKLRDQPSLFLAQWFVLETQPPKNIKSYAISHILATALRWRNPTSTLRFMSASQKFTILDKEKQWIPAESTKKNLKDTTSAKMSRRYRQRKKWAVNICDSMTRSLQQGTGRTFGLLDTSPFGRYRAAKKKDDLADAMLYALAILLKTPQKEEKASETEEPPLKKNKKTANLEEKISQHL